MFCVLCFPAFVDYPVSPNGFHVLCHLPLVTSLPSVFSPCVSLVSCQIVLCFVLSVCVLHSISQSACLCLLSPLQPFVPFVCLPSLDTLCYLLPFGYPSLLELCLFLLLINCRVQPSPACVSLHLGPLSPLPHNAIKLSYKKTARAPVLLPVCIENT